MSKNQPVEVEDRPLAERLRPYGCPEIIPLDRPLFKPAQLEYLDLLPRQGKGDVAAVAEHQGTALLYLVDAPGDEVADAKIIGGIKRRLANRSDPAWLGVVRTGSLEIHPIGFHENDSTIAIHTVRETDTTAPMFFQSLVHGSFAYTNQLRGTDYVFKKIFSLLTQTTDEFVPLDGEPILRPLDVLSMAGRALFFRFLIDRHIVLEAECGDICAAAKNLDLKDAFSSPRKSAQTSAWLDSTFNGDFMRLIDERIPADDRPAREKAYFDFFQDAHQKTNGAIFNHLNAILRGWRAVGGDFQPELDWGELDFAHIPVGVLSQVYESFSHRADSRTARKTSVHYTPRSIAGLMIEQAFAAVKDPSAAHILDSSCGAGIFLVLAFRRLVRERWQQNKQRPGTRVIQDILYNQLSGFDVSESALRLAALALYITAIEVNGTQRPPKELKFPKNLRDEVLFHFGDEAQTANGQEKASRFPLGSLGPKVPAKFDSAFDIVIGNPPWTRLREDEPEGTEEMTAAGAEKRSAMAVTDVLNDQFTEIGRRVLRARGFGELADIYENPDKNPDLPFLWRATEWAKYDGVVALAMPARIFGRTTGKGYEAWRAVLRRVALTGLINGADLRKTAVWEGIDMPFCLLFARNTQPTADQRFFSAAPSYEPGLNRNGYFRIDYETTQPISTARVEEQPWLLKTLSLGTWLDVEVMEGLTRAFPKTLADAWIDWDPKAAKTGQGYNRSPRLRQSPYKFLADMKDFKPKEDCFSVEWDSLNTYQENHGTKTAAWPRNKLIYQPPLVIIPQAPGETTSTPKAYISGDPLAFSQSYYGYSCAGHPQAGTLAALLYLLPHSILFAYFCLMTSRRSGFDRQTFNKEEFDALPFPDVARLASKDKTAILTFAHRLEHDVAKPWDKIDSLLFRLYGLDDDAVQVAKDALFAAASYRKAGKAALERTTQTTRADFLSELEASVEPYFDVCGEHVAVTEPEFQPDTWDEPWFFLAASRVGQSVSVNPSLLRRAMELANESAASRIIVKAPNRRGLLIGLLNQRRWWTITRARLCAQHIIRQHLGAFGLPEQT